MKYITIFAVILAISPLFCGCSVFQTVKEEPFSVKLESPKVQAGVIEAQAERMLNIGGLRKTNITVDYYPVEDAVCLQYRLDFMTFYQFWNKEGRAIYLKALEQYKEDYEQRTLNSRGSKKTKSQYGRTDGYLIWQAAKYLTRARAPVNVDLGYYIRTISKNRVAFFTLFQREAVFIDENTKNEKRQTTDMTMYLTRAQADELAELFDQGFLSSLDLSKSENRIQSGGFDSY